MLGEIGYIMSSRGDSDPHSSECKQPKPLELTLLLAAVICCYCVLYGPQVLLNRWIERYALNPSSASSLVYATLIPMSVAPLSYGFFLGVSDTRKVTLWAMGTLALITLSLAFTDSYALIMTCRLAQGFTLPAILTAIMARLSAAGPLHGPRLITYYLCATVIGGLFGRLITGYCADLIGLDMVWWIWSSVCAFIALGIACFPSDHVPFNNHVVTRQALSQAIMLPSVRASLFCCALMFGGFAAALNLLPLRVEALGATEGNVGESAAVAHRYWGYLAGVVVALTTHRLDRILGGRGRAPAMGLIVMAGALFWGTLSLTYAPLSVMVLGLCIGLFITHPLLISHLTQLNPAERGLMSGMYVSSYYIGGASCSWWASLYMERVGWKITLITLALMLIAASGVLWFALKKRGRH